MLNDHTVSNGALMMTSCLDRNGGCNFCLQTKRAASSAKPYRSRAAARPPQDETDPRCLARLGYRKKEASLVFTLSILQTNCAATCKKTVADLKKHALCEQTPA